MKIIYCIPQLFRPGGIERIVSIKANWFADIAGYDVIIIAAFQNNQSSYYPLSAKIRLIDLDIDYDGILGLPLFKRIKEKRRLQKIHKVKLENILLNEKSDIVVSTFTHEASFLPLINDGSRKVLEFHFCRGHKKKMANAFGFGLLTKLAYFYRCWEEENKIIPMYDQFVVLTDEDKKNWQNKIPEVKSISNILPFEKEGKAVLDAEHVIAVGRLDAQKGFDRLINIWSKVVVQHPGWILDIYGQGQDEDELRNLILENGLKANIIIHKPDQNIKDRYLESSIFVMTSAYEGLPMTLLEATGLGLPAICYDFPCGPKDVIDDGINGFLISDGDEESFVERLSMLMDDENLRKEIGHNAYEMSVKYGKEVIMNEWNRTFKDLIIK